MIPSHRRWFNENYTPEKYRRFLQLLELECGEAAQFRHSETPCFLPGSLVAQMAQAGREMVEQLMASEQYQQESRAAIPPEYCVPKEDPRPLFVQADFGLDAARQPKLVEIQGFPTLYAYQPLIAASYREAYGIDSRVAELPDGLDRGRYISLLREAIVGRHDRANVVLAEIDPANQKTRHDFVMTERTLGVRTVNIAALRKRGNRLFYDRDGIETPVHRIYNRAIVDELVRKQVRLNFDFRDELDVEWAGHPNWFFRLSKFSLPYLRHAAAPWTEFLSNVREVEHPERYVLKPLYSFAGSGVIVGPVAEQLAAVPENLRSEFVLQERVNFQPVVETPYGPTKIEVRIMYLWLDRLRPVNTIVRMGRGSQMGVDHNKKMEWVGGSAGFIDPEC